MIYVPYGLPYVGSIRLEAAAGGSFQANPTLAAGDVKIYSEADAAGANLDTLPSVLPALGRRVMYLVSAAENTCHLPSMEWIDAAGGEWLPRVVEMQTVPPALLGLATGGLATAGGAATITVAAGTIVTNDDYKGCTVATIWGTGAGQQRVISGTVAATQVVTVSVAWGTQPDNTTYYWIYLKGSTASIPEVDLTRVDGVALDSHEAGQVPADVAHMQADVVSADAVATGALGAAEVAADAASEIAAAVAGVATVAI